MDENMNNKITEPLDLNINGDALFLDKDRNNTDYIEDNVLLLDTNNISDIKLNKKLFIDGVDEVSKLCGMISALCNVGITPSAALNYISNKEESDKAIDYNYKISELNSNAIIESSKYSMNNLQKTMI